MTEFELDMSEFLDLFIDESRQNLQTLNRGLLALERSPDDRDVVEEVFRAAHTLKGMAATMGYDKVSRLSHALEDALDTVRGAPEALTETFVTLAFRGVDAIELLIRDIAEGGAGDGDVAAVESALRGYEYDGSGDVTAPSVAAGDPTVPPEHGQETGPRESGPTELGPDQRGPDRRGAAGALAPSGVSPAAPSGTMPPPTLVRLDVQRLDRLLDVVTEMVIHRSYLTRLQARWDHRELDEALARQSQLLDQLQAAVLDTRMVPVGQAFDRFPRMVRDLLKSQGKEADLTIVGAQVELDRTMLAAINDALVHLLRNAVDHGLETPEVRLAAGKPRAGILHLEARAERNSVVIEVRDDGRGIDVARVRERALARELVTAAELADMTEGQILRLLCEPGFSLAETVTDISGRGVGMDAVLSQVNGVRGQLEIETTPGHGTTFRLRLPVNLALTDAIVIRIGDETYVVPNAAVERIVEVVPAQVSRLGERLLLDLPDGVVPLRHACSYLGGTACSLIPPYALVIRQQDQITSIGIDGVLGYEQVVAKPVPPALAAISGLSGVTILGEGRVVFILDPAAF